MSIMSDEYFVGLIESVWMISENEDKVAFKNTVEELTEAFVGRLKEFAHPFDSQMLEKLFKEFNKSKSLGITIDEVANMLRRLGFSVERKYLTGLFKKFDMNNSGAIEHDEFVAFLTSRAYSK
eukprot:TRINITY_DN17733_c0_g1_i5.p2 TRINITY_DN17733_c0_g1~~TRINITY_DN17733_c0_g1_i5.p2  ORF type:complete len:123 (+),score=28.20 TRINITY_DN17733_c0_g1_i5:230-598(+)